MRIMLENIEEVISEHIYKNIASIEEGSVVLDCELSGHKKIYGCCIYLEEKNVGPSLIFGEFNCRVSKTLSKGLTKRAPTKGHFEVSYDNKSKSLIETTFYSNLLE